MRKHWLTILLLIYFFVYLGVCYSFRGAGFSDEASVLVSVATFLYGIFIAFSIFNHQNRLTTIREMLRTDDAFLLSIYRGSSVFGEDVQKKTQKHIDNYLISQIDYKITDDYHESSEAFSELSNYIVDLDPKTDKQVAVYQNLVGIISSSSTNRKLVGTLVRERLTMLEWFSIMSLHALIAYLVFTLNTGTFISSVIAALIVTTSAVMIVVLYHLNTLTWQEEKWIWKPLHNLFVDLELIPYYPDFVISRQRAVVPANSTIRVCHYTKPYPDMSDKEIEQVQT